MLYWCCGLARAVLGWAIVSVLLGLGFTFFSGAVEAWLVDALHATDTPAASRPSSAAGRSSAGIAMLAGSVLGGVIAQATNLGVPFLMRAAILLVMFVVACGDARPGLHAAIARGPLQRATHRAPRVDPARTAAIRRCAGSCSARRSSRASASTSSTRCSPTCWSCTETNTAYTVAGLAAALLSGAQMLGGAMAPWVRKLFHRRTSTLLLSAVTSAIVLIGLGLVHNFWFAVESGRSLGHRLRNR